jgi:hypothetical protein
LAEDSLPTNKPNPAMLNASIKELGEKTAILLVTVRLMQALHKQQMCHLSYILKDISS